jgi:D-serine deaminase-like pyridoxal phosphate-dependent protein
MDDTELRRRRFQAVIDHFGEHHSRQLLPTPALVCDVELLMDNIARMAAITASANVALRPHVKSHKSAYVARLQLDAGAAGLAFAKLSEAEAVVQRLRAEGHIGPISALLTSPLVGASVLERALTLARDCDLMLVVDHEDAVEELAKVFGDESAPLSVLCDVDVGLARTGVVSPAAALRVVERIVTSRCLHFAGVQGYGGQLQHIHGREERRGATQRSAQRLQDVIDLLEREGYRVPLRTGGGTGTSEIDIEIGLLNELQPGSYVFMDREYRDALGSDPEGRFRQSLTIATTVVSSNQENFVTVDAGLKAMATDAGTPLVVAHEETARYEFFGDEHGLVTKGPHDSFRRGDRLDLVPPHCDPTVDRYDVMWLVRGDVVEGVADVVARGCSQ